MTFPGLVRANNLSDVTDREKAWDNLGANIAVELALYESAGIDLFNSLSLSPRVNPNGNWSYGYTTALGSTAITLVAASISTGWNGPGAFGTPFFLIESSSEVIESCTSRVAGNFVTVLRWTAPFSGAVGIQAAFQRREVLGDGMIPRIYKEGVLLYDGGTLTDTTTVASFGGLTSVIAGETIDFQVGPNGTFDFDTFSYNYVRILTV
jgi:hypothetical protein